jgi:uncharacterized protein
MKLCPICATSYPAGHRTCPTHGTVLVETAELPPGTIIRDCYRIERTLGSGGMGTVYLAEHTLMGEPRALKFLSAALASNPTFVQRFLQEARSASKLRHPNIAATLELGQSEDGSFYISMEYVDGPSLRSVITESNAQVNDGQGDGQGHGMPVERAFSIIRGVAEGLGAAHVRRMVHRDVKPENILLATTQTNLGPVEMAKVVDFGIVAIHSADGGGQLTQTGRPLLTAEYGAPEQWRGSLSASELDGRTDLYSMGCMFFEMLTGSLPFHSDSYEGWFEQHVCAVPPSPSYLRPELAGWAGLDALVLSLLAKDREQRPASTADFLEQLDLVIAHGAGTRNLSREPTRNDLHVRPTGAITDGQGRTALDIRTARPTYAPGWAPNPPAPQASAGYAPANPAPYAPVSQGAYAPQQPAPQQQPGYQQNPNYNPNPAYNPNPGYAPNPGYQPNPVYAAPAQVPIQPSASPRPPRPAGQVNQRVLFAVLGTFLLLTIGVVAAFVLIRKNEAAQSDQAPVQRQIEAPAAPVSDAGASLPPGDQPATSPPTAPTQPVTPATGAGSRPVPAAVPKMPAMPTDPVSIAAKAIALYNEKDYADAAALLTQACAGGQADSCDYLGYAYQHKLGLEQDFSRAATSFDKGCQHGSMAACSHLAAMYVNKTGVVQDYPHALELYTKACNGDYAEACQNLGSMYQFKKGVEQDYPKAVSVYGKACNQGSMAGCNSLGGMYQRSQGVEQDYAKAVSLYTKACGGGFADGCNNLGYMYQQKLGVEQDYAKAAELYTKACTGGNAFACNNLGIMYQAQQGVDRDYMKAATYYAKACDGGSSNGCSDLGELYRRGLGMPKDSEKARKYLSKGCDLGNQFGCEHLKQVE